MNYENEHSNRVTRGCRWSTWVVLAASVALSVTNAHAKDHDGAYVASSQGWNLTAGTPQGVDKGIIRGSVTFERLSGADTRGGGACLVADLNKKFPCETDPDCGSLAVSTGGYNYCAGVNGSEEGKICWTRPSDNCTRSPVRQPGTYFTKEVPDRVDGKNVNWITIACMGDETAPMGCGSGDPALSVRATSFLFGKTK